MNESSALERAAARARTGVLWGIAPILLLFGCAEREDPEVASTAVAARVAQAVTDPVGLCNQDPRVNMGMVPLSVCAGARVFFDETFGGNGRTCGSCHPAANNYTIEQAFISTLPATDPLFVFENPAFNLGTLETDALRGTFALIRENVDGFEDINNKFVSRSVSHTLSLATSTARDPADGTSAAFLERTGWGGDGSPDGSMRAFLDGAIKQHYPKDPSRTPGTSFRLATNAEKDQVLAFQLALGRLNELNLNQVTLTDPNAAGGQRAFMDPLVGRCNECHGNAGANALATGKNRNFNTGVIQAPTAFVTLPNGGFLFDGGFGGQGLAQPNLTTVTGTPDAFGNGTFSPPPLIEAADTGPFFHTHAFGLPTDPTTGLEGAVSFYATSLFLTSPAALELDARFGGRQAQVGPVIGVIGSFLRVLNASFNLAMAKQRLDASRTLNIAYWSYRDDIQKGLIRLASEEMDDAIRVLANGQFPLHTAQQTSLQNARTLLAQALAATDPAIRRARTESANTLVQQARSAFGTGLNFSLGTGNLMF